MIFLLGCGGSTASFPAADSAPSAPTEAAIECASLPPCRPDLGVCLRCTTQGNPEWVWSEAPGSPRVLALSPATMSMSNPDLEQDCCWGHPFDHGVPDCARFEFDQHGMPLATRATSEVEEQYRYGYQAGRVVTVEVDEVPFCVSNDFGDQSPCGVPDGTFDRSAAVSWDGLRMTAGGAEWRFDEESRLSEWRTRDGFSGRNTFEGDHVSEQYQDNGSAPFTMRFSYDGEDHLVLAERSFADHVDRLRWTYDAHGWPTRRVFPTGVVEYDNEYDEGGQLVSRVIRPIESATQHGAPTTFLRRYDEHGLLVEEKREPNGIVGSASTRWERDERGVPRAVVQNGQRVDQSCLLPLARYFR